ncbi:MAG TPA: hypothetical protein VF320_12095, partial [Acidimicrobiales bacterium]
THRDLCLFLVARLAWDPYQMKKLLVFVAVLAGVGLLVRRFAPELEKIDWEKKFEAMPDNAPPKWMFRNITAIRENTDRILEHLDQDQLSATTPGGGSS